MKLNFLRPKLMDLFEKKQTSSTIHFDLTKLKTVISYSLYGNAGSYIGGLILNCEIINRDFPTFWIYVFVGNDFDHSILQPLYTFSNIKIIETGILGDKNMSMRFTAIDYDEVGIAFSRDCDSFINRRDRYCIHKFLESDKKFQIIRENLEHTVKILGGMWAVKKGLLTFKIGDKIDEYYKNIIAVYGTDQHFLGKEIYPIVKDDSQIFDQFYHFPGENPEKIETGVLWTSYTHIGAAVPFLRAIE